MIRLSVGKVGSIRMTQPLKIVQLTFMTVGPPPAIIAHFRPGPFVTCVMPNRKILFAINSTVPIIVVSVTPYTTKYQQNTSLINTTKGTNHFNFSVQGFLRFFKISKIFEISKDF